jgi:hypothetical protein
MVFVPDDINEWNLEIMLSGKWLFRNIKFNFLKIISIHRQNLPTVTYEGLRSKHRLRSAAVHRQGPADFSKTTQI